MGKMTKRCWLILTTGILSVLLALCVVTTYVVDPFFQYRVKDNTYMLRPIYCSPGLIKNYDYDTIIIGSSMIQNFDMNLFRSELNCSPLHIGIGGMSDEDMITYIQLANKTGKARSYYLCIDISQFAGEDKSTVISYLVNDDIFSRIQYSISYESLFRFLPVDTVLSAATEYGFVSPSDRTSIDKLGNWEHNYTFGEEVVLEGYITAKNSVSEVETDDLYNRLVKGIDQYLSQIDLNGANYIFFFPPYSALFWSNAQERNYFDAYLEAKEYFIKTVNDLGAKVYDFQSVEITMDLNNYKDTTHYSSQINDWMTRCFSSGEYLVTSQNCNEYKNQLIANTKEFKNTYSYLFE